MTFVPTAWTEVANFLASIATFVGIPFAIVIFYRDRKRERREQEWFAYSTLSASYNNYLQRCIDHPELAVVTDTSPSLSEPDKRQLVHMNMVMSMLEAAYFMYCDQGSAFREKQWSGWNEYMRMWCRHPEVQKQWEVLIDHFDSDFRKHMNKLHAEVQAEKSVTSAAVQSAGSS